MQCSALFFQTWTGLYYLAPAISSALFPASYSKLKAAKDKNGRPDKRTLINWNMHIVSQVLRICRESAELTVGTVHRCTAC